MTRRRLRPAYSPAELAELYATPYDHTVWPEHRLRVAVTCAAARWLVEQAGVRSAADLMCGDGAVLDSLPIDDLTYGDLVPRPPDPSASVLVGPIEETAREMPAVDLTVLTEALEHLDDPDLVLKLLRAKATRLLLSTPAGAGDDPSEGHYWSWDREDVEGMLAAAGWVVEVYQEVDLRPGGGLYSFGLWVAR